MKQKKSVTKKKSNPWLKRLVWILLTLFILMNVVAFLHAYRFTHFSSTALEKTKSSKNLTLGQKFQMLIFGISNPRPENKSKPSTPFTTFKLKSNREIECWSIKTDSAKGTVILFHGYGGDKSSMLDKADLFRELGYNTLLVDFMGSGGSEGNQTTVGYFEAEEVKSCYDYIAKSGEKNIFLFGTSMGSVAIMKSINDYNINPKGIIIECPFGSLYQTVRARFQSLNIPSFPMSGLLVFWGGLQNGFWGFGHKPTEYAKSIHCPTLLLYGAADEKVSREEIDQIFQNLKGPKQLEIYPKAGHENYLHKYHDEWKSDVQQFLSTSDASGKLNK